MDASSSSPPSLSRSRKNVIFWGAVLLLALGANYFVLLKVMFFPIALFLWIASPSRIDSTVDFLFGAWRNASTPLPGEPSPTDPKFDRSLRACSNRWIANVLYPDKDYPKIDPPAQ